MTEIISKDQYEKWAMGIASKIDASKIIGEGVVEMTTKKNKIDLAQTTNVLPVRKADPFWQHKTAEELAIEQGIKPVKDQDDFARRYLGGLEDWDDIDEFLKEVHKPLK